MLNGSFVSRSISFANSSAIIAASSSEDEMFSKRIKILSELLFDAPFVSVVKDRDLKTGEVKSSRFDRDLGFKKV